MKNKPAIEDKNGIKVARNPQAMFASILAGLVRSEMRYSGLPTAQWLGEAKRRWPELFANAPADLFTDYKEN